MRLRNKYIPSPDILHTNTDEDVVTTGGEPRLLLPVDEDDEESSQPVEEIVAEETATPSNMASASGAAMPAVPALSLIHI